MQIELEPPTTEGLAAKPVATGNDPVARMLLRWQADGSAAGNVGDVYYNRDGRHSQLPMDRFPQLRQVKLAPNNKRRDWSLFLGVIGHVTVGNSSTAAGVRQGGSIPRSATAGGHIAQILALQHQRNNLFIYPEHRDYDPGLNGLLGYGDLYFANTPYLIASQGSSGSDQAFLRALFRTLAAFRPDTKDKLRESGMLMPTLQMILRRSMKDVLTDEDYLSARAHPVVFQGSNLRSEVMIGRAHGMAPDEIPPIAVLAIGEESDSLPGRDFFHPRQPERHFATFAAVCRVYRGPRAAYRMVVSAAPSLDLNDRPLTYHWRVLSGDRERITIKPLSKTGDRVEISVPYRNGAWPTPFREDMDTSRVDIACFVHNGKHYSPPAFISVFMPRDQLMATNEAGRVIEVGHGAFDTTIGKPAHAKNVCDGGHMIRDWAKLLEAMTADDERGAFWRKLIADEDAVGQLAAVRKRFGEAQAGYERARSAHEGARKEMRDAKNADEATRAGLRKAQDEARRTLDAANAQRHAVLNERDLSIGRPPRWLIETVLNRLRTDPELYVKHQQEALKLAPGIQKIVRETRSLGVLTIFATGRDAISPIRGGDGPPGDRLSDYERMLLERLHYCLLNELSGRAMIEPEPLYVDPRIKLPRRWRDLYRYDSAGNLTGWTRRRPDANPQEFTADGRLIVQTDGDGRPTKTLPVQYVSKGELKDGSLRLEMEVGGQ